jgi:hypothetical protein
MGDFEVNEHLGDDADDTATGGEGGFSECLHEADVGSAVDDADVLLCEDAAKFSSGFAVDGAGAVGGGAEDGNVRDHELEDIKSRVSGA